MKVGFSSQWALFGSPNKANEDKNFRKDARAIMKLSPTGGYFDSDAYVNGGKGTMMKLNVTKENDHKVKEFAEQHDLEIFKRGDYDSTASFNFKDDVNI
ncbi:MAG: hypothetical protein A2Y25_03410 [Candidatus Melainabacteria bacterium GWF2_37_15]|nr:MAG: hypothetical protein A2Y25_03410 [Candidatus Melainabacteria bacterium GWF2_37_15]